MRLGVNAAKLDLPQKRGFAEDAKKDLTN